MTLVAPHASAGGGARSPSVTLRVSSAPNAQPPALACGATKCFESAPDALDDTTRPINPAPVDGTMPSPMPPARPNSRRWIADASALAALGLMVVLLALWFRSHVAGGHETFLDGP